MLRKVGLAEGQRDTSAIKSKSVELIASSLLETHDAAYNAGRDLCIVFVA